MGNLQRRLLPGADCFIDSLCLCLLFLLFGTFLLLLLDVFDLLIHRFHEFSPFRLCKGGTACRNLFLCFVILYFVENLLLIIGNQLHVICIFALTAVAHRCVSCVTFSCCITVNLHYSPSPVPFLLFFTILTCLFTLPCCPNKNS